MQANIENHRTSTIIPKDYQGAMESEKAENWKNAMQEEMESICGHQVWKLVPREKNIKVVKSKWVYTVKENLDGSIQKYKAKLVAVGYSQKEGIDYDQSFAPVVKLESFRYLIAMASIRKFQIRQYDVTTAYLYGTLEIPVYLEQPKGFVDAGRPDYVCQLQRSLYGLPQSDRSWNEKFDKTLKKIGLQPIPEDPCVYKLETEGKTIILGIYVDDCIVIGTDNLIINEVMSRLGKEFKLTETRVEIKFLNIKVEERKMGFNLSQEGYVEKMLIKYGLEECNVSRTPLDAQQNLDDFQGSPLTDKTQYQKMLESLMYLSVGTRSDISFAVSRLSQYSHEPRKIHLMALKRVYRYVKGTKDYK